MMILLLSLELILNLKYYERMKLLLKFKLGHNQPERE
jgi:hypothetical protein